jgi:pSer/pThr/pTyr-binding forkhead associated (FHA) protein
MGSEPLEPSVRTAEEARARFNAQGSGLPFLLYRDGSGSQAVVELSEGRVTIGRRAGNDVALGWDAQVSRVHAELTRMGDDWVLCDEGMSHNGTFVNGERVRGRRRLHGGDAITVGDTLIAFCGPQSLSTVATAPAERLEAEVELTPAQRRVLVALCRPLAQPGYAAPASNQQIAAELFLSVDTVKGTLTQLFERFGVEHLPQNAKRATLAARGVALLDQR